MAKKLVVVCNLDEGSQALTGEELGYTCEYLVKVLESHKDEDEMEGITRISAFVQVGEE